MQIVSTFYNSYSVVFCKSRFSHGGPQKFGSILPVIV